MPNKPGSTRGQYNVKPTKLCRGCDTEKDRSEFYQRGQMVTKAGRPVLMSVCKECHKANVRAFPSMQPEAKRAKKLMDLYGITVEQYDEMLARQGSGCAICGGPPGGRWDVLVVDHCHATGRVRGLLCNSCNRAIGLLGDNIGRLRMAIKYLEGGESDF